MTLIEVNILIIVLQCFQFLSYFSGEASPDPVAGMAPSGAGSDGIRPSNEFRLDVKSISARHTDYRRAKHVYDDEGEATNIVHEVCITA